MDPALAELSAKERALIWDEFNRVIATLHSVDYVTLGLGDEPTRPFVHSDLSNQFARQMEVREVLEDFSGEATVAGYTVLYGRGQVPKAVLLVDTAHGMRAMATSEDAAIIAFMEVSERVGRLVRIADNQLVAIA